ncbi:MAG: hypothetical protein ACC661_08190, partial [Verrucomicrobiales bacterium]
MSMRSWSLLIPGAVALAALVGCLTYDYSDTILFSDGRVERALNQKIGHTPEAVAALDLWKEAEFLGDEGFAKGDAPWESSSQTEDEDKKDNFSAWAEFESVAAIPDFLVKKSADGARETRLQRRFERTDYVFALEHVWEERLTGITSIPDSQKAAAELAALMIEFGAAVLRQWHGPEYDIDELVSWFESEGTAWWLEFVILQYDRAVQNSGRAPRWADEEDRRRQKELAALFTGHGVR